MGGRRQLGRVWGGEVQIQSETREWSSLAPCSGMKCGTAKDYRFGTIKMHHYSPGTVCVCVCVCVREREREREKERERESGISTGSREDLWKVCGVKFCLSGLPAGERWRTSGKK